MIRYFEDNSEWTLDYPPMFAYFEYALSHIARYFDPEMLSTRNLYYASAATIMFQRLSVIVSELFYAFSLFQYCVKCLHSGDLQRWTLFILAFMTPGLLIVDHIHFQYNGFLSAFLVLSLLHAKLVSLHSSYVFPFTRKQFSNSVYLL